MSLSIDNLRFNNFRGYKNLYLEGLSELVIFVGPNAIGKTNLIEGIQLLTSAKSFRNPKWADLILWDSSQCEISLSLKEEKRLIEHKLCINADTHSFFVNDKKKSSTEFSKETPSIYFIPDNLQLIKAASALRRAEIDNVGTQLSSTYKKLVKDYNKTLKQRNQLIKQENMPSSVLESWTDSLILIGSKLSFYRWKLFNRIINNVQKIYHQISSEEKLEARYIFSWQRFSEDGRQLDNEAIDCLCSQNRLKNYGESSKSSRIDLDYDKFLEYKKSNLEKENATNKYLNIIQEELHNLASRVKLSEQQRHVSLIGPQKDEILFYLNGKNARQFASQGQQRSIVLALKIAELMTVEEITGRKPFLLLDDVMSELDKNRREMLTKLLIHTSQTFITTTNIDYFSKELLNKASVLTLPLKEK